MIQLAFTTVYSKSWQWNRCSDILAAADWAREQGSDYFTGIFVAGYYTTIESYQDLMKCAEAVKQTIEIMKYL